MTGGSRVPARHGGEKTSTATQRLERTKKRKRFPHGNYTGYYSTRYGTDPSATSASPAAAAAPPGARDPRLGLMRRSWFEGKKCLDVGCNEGYLTLALVRSFRPRRIIGIDIDSYLVQRAGRALLTEIKAASGTNETAVFRPLMPRSLRGGDGGAQTTPPSTSAAVDAFPAGKPAGVGNGAAKRRRSEKCDTSAGGGDGGAGGSIGGDGDGSCGTSPSTRAAELGVRKKKGGRSRRKTDTSNADTGSMLPEPPLLNGDTSGSLVGAGPCVAVAPQRLKSERLGGSLEDAASAVDRPPTDETAVAAAAGAAEPAAAASTVAAAAVAGAAAVADAQVLSGCAVSFRCEDFVAEDHGDRGYDVVCLFSIVKWIHINGGDEAVRGVFHKAYDILQRGGRLILEPQPWKSYRKSARQHGSAEARVIVDEIKLRPSDFPALLTEEVGFRSWEEVGLPAEGVGGFAKRSVHVFVK